MKKDEEDEEDIDLEKALTETKPNLEIAEAGEEVRSKTQKRKSSKKKVETKKDTKDETVEVVKEENAEEATETADDDKKGE